MNATPPIAGLMIVEPSTTFCNCKAAYSAGLLNGMFYICIIILIVLAILILYFKYKKDKEEEEEDDEEEDEFYNGEET